MKYRHAKAYLQGLKPMVGGRVFIANRAARVVRWGHGVIVVVWLDDYEYLPVMFRYRVVEKQFCDVQNVTGV